MEKLILQELSKQVLFLGVSMKTKGGMTAVLVSYDKYIEICSLFLHGSWEIN